MTNDPVEILTPQLAPELPPLCPCGTYPSEPEQRHAQAHLEWSAGVAVSPAVQWATPGTSVAIVTMTSPAAWRKLAHRCARVTQRAAGYDGVSFPYLTGLAAPDEEGIRAHLYRSRNRVVGYLAASDRPARGHWDLVSPQATPVADSPIRASADVLFVATAWHPPWDRQRAHPCTRRPRRSSHPRPRVVDTVQQRGSALALSLASPERGVWVS